MTESLRGFDRVLDRFEETEGAVLPSAPVASPRLSAIGSVAAEALKSDLLGRCLADRGVAPAGTSPSADLDELTTRDDWALALVLSPWKTEAPARCDVLTPAARSAGVVDTMLQSPDGTRYGVNTNAFGVAYAVDRLMAGASPQRCLVLGTGATTRSAVAGLQATFPGVTIGVRGRNPDRTAACAGSLGIEGVDDLVAFEPDLVVNATTVGEKQDSRMEIPVEGILAPGVRFFDINNRTSQLQRDALAAGCVTASGVMMQLVVNSLRAYMLAPRRVPAAAGSSAAGGTA